MTVNPDHLQQRIVSDSVEFIYRGLSKVVVTLTLMPIVLVAVMWDRASHGLLLAWLALSLLVTAARVGLAWLYHRKAVATADAARWGWLFAVTSLASGLLWGGGNVLFFVPDSTAHQLFMFTATIGLVAGSTVNSSQWMPAYYGFAVPAIFGMSIALMSQGGAPESGLAFLIFMYLGIAVLLARNMNETLRENIRLKYENVELIEELRERRIVAEQASRDKTRFLAAASHDLRQPVHALSLFHEALKRELSGRRRGEILEKAASSLQSLEDLLSSLLDISRLDAGVEEPKSISFSVRALLQGLYEEFLPQATEQGLKLRLHTADIAITSDMVMLANLIRNLLSNAIRYTPEGGILLASRRRGDGVVIEVWDTGIGIAERDRERIFSEFQQLNNPERDRTKGLGLGLAICRRLAVLLHGELSVDSREGAGSVFRLKLSAVSSHVVPAEANGEYSQEPGGDCLHGRRVLIVDDERQVRVAMKAMLDTYRCDVWLADGEAQAQRLLAEKGPPDIVLSDLRLRDDESGVEVIRNLRKQSGSMLPALLISGDTSPERLKQARASRLVMLHKPVKPANLRSALEDLLCDGSGH